MTMTAPTTTTTLYRPAPARPGDDRFVPLAAELGARFAERAAEHDRDNTFVEENYALLRDSGYTALPIPEELGGLGASLRQTLLRPGRACPLLRRDGPGRQHAPLPRLHQHLPLQERRGPGRGAAPADRQREADPDDQRRLGRALAEHDGHPRERRLRPERPQGVLQPVPDRQRPLDVRHLRRSGRGEDGPGDRPADVQPGHPDRRDLGHPRDARHRQPRRPA